LKKGVTRAVPTALDVVMPGRATFHLLLENRHVSLDVMGMRHYKTRCDWDTASQHPTKDRPVRGQSRYNARVWLKWSRLDSSKHVHFHHRFRHSASQGKWQCLYWRFLSFRAGSACRCHEARMNTLHGSARCRRRNCIVLAFFWDHCDWHF
jgi:hypothetical protein